MFMRFVFYIALMSIFLSVYASSGEADKKPEPLKLPMIIIPVIIEDEVRYHMRMQIICAFKDPEIQKEANKKVEKIIDRVFTYLYRIVNSYNVAVQQVKVTTIQNYVKKAILEVLPGTEPEVYVDKFAISVTVPSPED